MSDVDVDDLASVWPLFGLRLRVPGRGLLLRPVVAADAPALGRIVQRLLPPEQHYYMPQLMDNALAETASATARNILRYVWRSRSETTPSRWAMPLAVVADGRIVGTQSIDAEHFAVTRQVHTGSYLDPERRRQGIGTAMRAVVLELAFRHLRAETATSGYMTGNEASRTVSERLGYRPDGIAHSEFRGERCVLQRMRLDADRWPAFRPHWLDELEVDGIDDVAPLLVGG